MSNNHLDIGGIALSLVCVMHCLVFPAAAVAAPLLAPGLAEQIGLAHEWHLILIAIAAPVSIIALGWGVKISDGSWRLLAAGLVGLGLMALGASHMFSELIETLLTLAGVTTVAVAHGLNYNQRRRRGHVHERDCGMCEDDVAAGR
ncbi:MerC domain-containing protein [Maricaulis sp. MIT060901]|uniref:MerC domain-containing protein n=1 Tax=Maricaulis sp. MIT060901 TaxID=3096993 RepID=UPI00399BDEC5